MGSGWPVSDSHPGLQLLNRVNKVWYKPPPSRLPFIDLEDPAINWTKGSKPVFDPNS